MHKQSFLGEHVYKLILVETSLGWEAKLGNTVLTPRAILMIYYSAVLSAGNTDVVCITNWLYFCKLLANSRQWTFFSQLTHRCTHQFIPLEPEHQSESSSCLSQWLLIAFEELWWIYFWSHTGGDVVDLWIMYCSGIYSGSVAIFSFLSSHLPLKRINKTHLFDLLLAAGKVLLLECHSSFICSII